MPKRNFGALGRPEPEEASSETEKELEEDLGSEPELIEEEVRREGGRRRNPESDRVHVRGWSGNNLVRRVSSERDMRQKKQRNMGKKTQKIVMCLGTLLKPLTNTFTVANRAHAQREPNSQLQGKEI